MDRIIEVKINGNYVSKDNKNAGTQGEYNITSMRIEFDPGWDGYAKTITWWNAYGENPVKITLGPQWLEDQHGNLRIYLIKIPGEALEEAGECSFVIDGYIDGVRQRSVEDYLTVKPAKSAENAGQAADPTPSVAEELQEQIEAILADVVKASHAAEYADDAEKSSRHAYAYSREAELAKLDAESAQRRASEAADLAGNSASAAEASATQSAQFALGAMNQVTAAQDAAYEAKGYSETAAASASDAAESASAAAIDAQRAYENAQSVDAEEIQKKIEARADNLYYDTAKNMLYLTSGGEIIGDGVQVATGTGGGGGGGESNNAILTLTNTTGWLFKTISQGASCELLFNWSSLEGGIPTGDGVLRITVDNVVKHTAQIKQGAQSIDVGSMLNAGTNTVKLNVSDTYGNSRSINFSVTAISLKLESSFDPTVAYSGDIDFAYTPTGSVEKTVYFKMGSEVIGTATVSASGREQRFTIPAQSHGNHPFTVWFEATIEGESEPVKSNELFYDIICTEEGNTTPIIASRFRQDKAEQFENLTIPYIVYTPGNLSSEVVLSDGAVSKPRTVDRTEQVWTYRPDDFGEVTLSISSGNQIRLFTLQVSETTINVEAETSGLSLYLTSYGRSNTEANPGEWKSGSTAASLTGFNFTSDGWVQDEDGITVLRVAGDARVEIPTQIFATDFRSGGKTIELEFATRDVLNYDATVISCWSGERGLKVTAQKALLKSEQSEISTQYKEDEHVRLAFVVEKRSSHRLLMIYINGILSGVVQYADDDDFSQTSPVGISIGSSECTTDIYCIRVYDTDLSRYQVLDNWIADTQALGDKSERYRRNEVFDGYGQIVIDQLPPDLPYLILKGSALPTYKGNKLTIAGEYIDPVTPANGFTFTGAEIDVQGTSSAGYERKNYKIKFKNGFVQNGKATETYLLGKNNIPTDEFTFKADVASSEGANNVELVKLYNDISPYRTPPQLVDARVRQGIDGYPIVIFHNDGSKVTFIGKYNFNHDKATGEVFGFASGDESWETRNNTSKRALWQSADYSGSDWKNDFEARYPEDSTDVARLKALAEWLVSTDRSAVSSQAEKDARLAKFKAEFSNHLDLESALFYYLFTELFLLADSRAKNSFPTKYGENGWCWLPYDMDTAIGINNEGKLAFGYDLEDTDLVNGAKVYNGQDSVLWNNLRDAFPEELKEMYQNLRSDGGLSYEDTERRFEEHQAKWPEAIFNEDAYYKYLAPLFEKNNGSYLGMLQGSKAEQRKWWLYNRFRYIDSKYNAGDAEKDFITLRGYEKSDITVTPYADIYATIKYGSYLVQKRALRADGSQTLECPVDDLDDTEIYIYSASQLADVGDLSGLKVGYAEFASGTKLNALKLGDASASYSNANLTQLFLGNNVLLKTLDVRNCPNLGNTAADVNATPTIDLSGCTNIEEVYFDNTAITGCTLPNGGILKKLHLPATLANLTIRNQTQISEFVMPSYANISTLRLENVSNAVDGWSILHAMKTNSRVRMIGFDWTLDDPEAVLALYDRLDTMRGMDETGGNTDKPQMQGTIRIDALTGGQLAEMQRRYPSITIAYNSLVSFVRFYDETGNTLLYTAEARNGGDAVYGGTTPTKASTAQYTYAFSGWSLTPGGSANANALKNVTVDRDVYAAFTATVRTYTVRFYNGNTLLQTVNNVPYGGTAKYTGSTPVYNGSGNAADYKYTGFVPTGENITGNTDCYAQFKYSAYVYSKIIDRSINSDYENSLVTGVGAYAFYYASSLKSVNFPNASGDIGMCAFQYCAALSSVNIPNATQILGNAFQRTGLTSVNFPLVTYVGGSAFDSSDRLVTADFGAVTYIGSGAFSNCYALTTLIIRTTAQVCYLGGPLSSSCPIAKGSGYIYVPAALVDSYKSATNWSTYAAQIRALESYTVDGTTTGELDPTKI